jgi:NADH:ubiquinone reductase (H+-translocating)
MNDHIGTDGGAVPAGNGRPPRVVIAGGGFAGVEAARTLIREDVQVTLIDRRNYHLFQPLLYQIATAILQPSDIAVPLRRLFGRHGNALVLMDSVVGIRTAEKAVVTAAGKTLPYDHLILAPGAETSYFGNDAWRKHSFGLKSLDDAARIRQQVLLAFERAEMTDSEEERKRLLTFAIVGGGPNGIGAAVSLVELARDVLARDFRHIDPSMPRIVVMEAGERILPASSERHAGYAARVLREKKVELRVKSEVSKVDEAGVFIGDERIVAGTVIWTAGVKACPVAEWLGVEPAKGGRIEVTEVLTAPGHEDIYVLGDAALARGRDGKPLPGLAAVARQQGKFAARRILSRIQGRGRNDAFRYRDYGDMVPLGRAKAAARLGRMELTGIVAWVLWAAAHIVLLFDRRRQLMVLNNWFWAFAMKRNAARVIVEQRDLTLYHARSDSRDQSAPGRGP